jgi:hypothetical protein
LKHRLQKPFALPLNLAVRYFPYFSPCSHFKALPKLPPLRHTHHLLPLASLRLAKGRLAFTAPPAA